MTAQTEQKLYWSDGALVSYDAELGIASMFYNCGAFYLGFVDNNLKRDGLGIFFLPFCGMLFGRFAADRAHGVCLLKEPNGTYGVYTFRDGVQEGPAMRWEKGKGLARCEMYAAGLCLQKPLHENGESGEDVPNLNCVAALVEEFNAELAKSKLFGAARNDWSFSLGPMRNGQLQGVGIRFNSNFSIEKGVFANGQLRGCFQRLSAGLLAICGFATEDEREPLSLVFSAPRERWDLFKGDAIVVPDVARQKALRLIGEQFLRTGNSKSSEVRRLAFQADPNAILFNAALLEQKRVEHADWSSFFEAETLKEGFQPWLKVCFRPLNGFLPAEPRPTIGRNALQRRSCDALRADFQPRLYDSAHVFKEDLFPIHRRTATRVPESVLFTPRGKRDNANRNSIRPLAAVRTSVARAKPSPSDNARLSARFQSPENATPRTQIRRPIVSALPLRSLASPQSRASLASTLAAVKNVGSGRTPTETRPSAKSEGETATDAKTDGNALINVQKRSQTTEQTVDESINFSGSEQPLVDSGKFLGFYKQGNFKKPTDGTKATAIKRPNN